MSSSTTIPLDDHSRTRTAHVDSSSPSLLLTKRGSLIGRYGDYLGEVLASEGFAVEAIDLGDPGALEELARRGPGASRVIVAAALLSRREAQEVMALARGGAGVVAVRPSLTLQRELGLVSANTTIACGYLAPEPGSRVSGHLGSEVLQLLTVAENYRTDRLPAGSEVHAWHATAADSPDRAPAVMTLRVGEGSVTVLAYDVAHAVAIQRQGDPGYADGRSLGADDPYRPTDLLVGVVDPERWHVPQADLHCALLSNAVIRADTTRPVAPRLWYFAEPETGTVVVQDSDDDWSTREQFDELIDSATAHEVPITFYLMGGTRRTVLSAEKVRQLAAQGHSFGLHHNAFDDSLRGEEQNEVLEQVIADDLAWFAAEHGLEVLANRNHCLVWKGYADLPRIFERHGVVMEFNAENSPAAWLAYLAGSGRPMRHVDENGELIDVFQQATHVYDDSLVEERLSGDVAAEVELFREFLVRNRDSYFIPTTLQSHPVSFASYSRRFFEGCWAVAREEGIRILSADAWARATRGRRATRLSAASTDRGFVITASAPPDVEVVTIAVPLPDGVRCVASRAEMSLAVLERDVYGVRHALVRVDLGVADAVFVEFEEGSDD